LLFEKIGPFPVRCFPFGARRREFTSGLAQPVELLRFVIGGFIQFCEPRFEPLDLTQRFLMRRGAFLGVLIFLAMGFPLLSPACKTRKISAQRLPRHGLGEDILKSRDCRLHAGDPLREIGMRLLQQFSILRRVLRVDGGRQALEAYALEDYAAAKLALNKLHRELIDLNPSAARSLGEGMEET
jgi:hypothetical protein